MVGTKRSRPFSMEIPPTPPFRYQVPTFSPQINKQDSSFSSGSNTIINLESSGAVFRLAKFELLYILPHIKLLPFRLLYFLHAVFFRDMKMGSSLESKFKKCNTDYGSQDGNFLLFGSPAFPSPSTHISQQERSNFNTFPFQVRHNFLCSISCLFYMVLIVFFVFFLFFSIMI